MIGDLHLRSKNSTGQLSVTDLMLQAAARGLSHIAVADINTTEATAEATKAAARLRMTGVPAAEITSRIAGTDTPVSIIGYGFRSSASSVERVCATARSAVDASRGGAVATDTRPPAAREVIDAIHADGGLAVLAGPGMPARAEVVDALSGAGLDGLELRHPEHSPGDERLITALAGRYGLFLTGGTAGAEGFAPGDIVAPDGAIEHLTRAADQTVTWAESLVREAGRMARNAVRSRVNTEFKGGNIWDIVTEHDMAIDNFLTDSIKARFPDHGFITEEHDHPPVDDDTPVWIIDPIDGTTNFVSTRDYFAVSVAHYHGSTPVFGLVYDVMADEMYRGIAGGGATLNGRPLSAGRSGAGSISDCVVECSLSCLERLRSRYGANARGFVTALRGTRSYGSSTIGICRVARGTLDVYLSCSLSLWDYAAAAIVLAEAGGVTAVQEPAGEGGKRIVIAAPGDGVISEVTEVLFPEDRPDLQALQL